MSACDIYSFYICCVKVWNKVATNIVVEVMSPCWTGIWYFRAPFFIVSIWRININHSIITITRWDFILGINIAILVKIYIISNLLFCKPWGYSTRMSNIPLSILRALVALCSWLYDPRNLELWHCHTTERHHHGFRYLNMFHH